MVQMIDFDANKIQVRPIDLAGAKDVCRLHHYMKTAPSGAWLAFGIFYPEKFEKQIKGVAIFGRSTGTDAKAQLFPGCKPENILEMQRLWISDDLGHNAESKTLALMIATIKKAYEQIKVIWTYASGCKNDCGIVYQSSGFMYLGAEPCEDFYLTAGGEYKNIINVLRFGKAPKGLSKEQKAAHVYGPGKLLKTVRHYYFYPICKAVRRKMASKVLPFPKNSDVFRKDQQWIGAGQGDKNL